MSNTPHYDIIGDVHGQLATLETLLTRLGYRKGPQGWQQSGHVAVFVGDIIDKGPWPGAVLRLVRQMVDAGHALMVVGNHELNWVRDAYHHQDDLSAFIHATRQHNDRQRLVDEFATEEDGLALLLDHFQWLRTQPLFLELAQCRVVHAWWHEASLQHLKAMGIRCLDDAAMAAYGDTYSTTYFAMDRVIAGCEHTVRPYVSASGFRTIRKRVRWWPNDVALIHPWELLPTQAREHGYPHNAYPTFFGHYALTGTPLRLGRNVACLDYAAAYGGVLVAYTHSPGMPLALNNFMSVDVIHHQD